MSRAFFPFLYPSFFPNTSPRSNSRTTWFQTKLKQPLESPEPEEQDQALKRPLTPSRDKLKWIESLGTYMSREKSHWGYR